MILVEQSEAWRTKHKIHDAREPGVDLAIVSLVTSLCDRSYTQFRTTFPPASSACDPCPIGSVDAFTRATFFGSSSWSNVNNGCTPLSTRYGFLSYDVNGRQWQEAVQENTTGCLWSSTTVDTRSYDAENHTTEDNCTIDPEGSTIPTGCFHGDYRYTWGPSGKLRTYTGDTTGHTYTLHWDGDALLFISNESGQLAQTNIEKLGGITGGTLYVLDRDFSGTEVAWHTATAATNWLVAPDYTHLCCHGSGVTRVNACLPACSATPGDPPVADLLGTPLLLNATRSDGYRAGNVIIQGVRAYDPQVAQWTTPDAYKGDVHDPASQRSYMWNNNNPIAYSDPSGYVIEPVFPGEIQAFQKTAENIARGATEIAKDAAKGFKELSDGIRDVIENDLPEPRGIGGNNASRSSLPRDSAGNYAPHPDAQGAHTTLGTRQGRRESYTQGATFDENGKFQGRTDVTDHGRTDHANPHFHPETGPASVGKAVPIEHEL